MKEKRKGSERKRRERGNQIRELGEVNKGGGRGKGEEEGKEEVED